MWLWLLVARRTLFPMLLPVLFAGCGERERPGPATFPPIDAILLERCPDPLLPEIGKPRRDNDPAYVDAYAKLAICQDRHWELVGVVRKAQQVNGREGGSAP